MPPKIIKACKGLLDPRFSGRELIRSNVDAQSVNETSEDSFIFSVGKDSITESVTKSHHIVRVQAVMSEDSIRNPPLK
ncbi:hypothetical protein GGR58DRAFT_509201 [Xylaria digitata]|nr:hypothetical protein GGR58DRAFT_509201 [Xylaria digitata]